MGQEKTVAQSPQDRLLEIQLERETLALAQAKRAEKEFQDKKQQEEAFRLSRIKAVEKERQEREYLQNACPHKKQNNRPAIGGQKDHQGHFHFLCLFCNREWIDGALPLDLRIPMEFVGGPQ